MPSVYTIPPTVSFVDALAHGLLRRSAQDPLALSPTTVLLPTRRGCRALQEAFLRACGAQALLLPRLVPLGDLDAEELALAADETAFGANGDADLPPAMPTLKRQLLLARLIRHWGRVRGQPPSEDQAVRLAGELARLLDQVETEGLNFDGLEDLVPEDYAAHWQLTLRFLEILTEQWPAMQKEHGCIGPAERRRRLLEAQAAAWHRASPEDPVVAAGSTGSIPATAALLGVVAELPRGMLVLPGLDTDCDEATWEAIRDDPSHPQYGLAVLLARLGIAREQVRPWPDLGLPAAPAARARIVNTALAPAAATAGWRAFADAADADAFARALKGVERIDCPGPGEEAAVIALVLRRALAEEGCRAALVTPDRGLARRVAAELGRWGLAVDDSAGVPLSDTPPGTFLRLSAEMIASAQAPLPLLAALKHPLAAGGRAPGDFRARVRELERRVLRGPRPAAGFAGLKRALRAAREKGRRDELRAWLAELEAMAAPFAKALRAGRPLAEIVDAHLGFAEALAASAEESGPARLWAGEAGAAAAGFVADLRAAAGGAPRLKGEQYPAVLTALLVGQVVRPRYGSHPRLSIWGPLEARLQHVDVLVLGGLNEGTWPAEVDPGPWLSRPMRADFGLPAPERRIGLAAHDFAQAFCAPRVFLTRATRVEGAPSVPSRWLLRLDALLDAFGLRPLIEDGARSWLDWAEALDRPTHPIQVGPPAPRPPLEARPRTLSVTKVETWMRDPYGLYAREILGLEPLKPIDSDPGAADFGIIIHKGLETFLATYPEALPDDPEAALIAIGREVFERTGARPGVWAFWWPRFRRIARWFAGMERERRTELARSFAELRGALRLEAPGGPFELIAKADRIDLLRDGSLAILDYKTGALPSKKEVDLGFAPQLPLEAAIALAGGFAGVPRAAVARLEYWRVSGGEPAGEAKPLKADPAEQSALALAGLTRLVTAFDDAETPYHATPRPQWARRFDDYGHLARAKEWAAGGLGEDGA
ncbi:MAG: double-strand break repair protein AddB [Kiloniellaceae bacterium]